MEACKKDKKVGLITFILGIIFMMAACHMTAQSDRREKIGNFWYSWSLVMKANDSDTLDLYGVFTAPYDFYCLGVKLSSKNKTIGSSVLVIYYENGVQDYLGCIMEDKPNELGYAYFYMNESEKIRMKTQKIKYINFINQYQKKDYFVSMESSLATTWYQSLLKQ